MRRRWQEQGASGPHPSHCPDWRPSAAPPRTEIVNKRGRAVFAANRIEWMARRLSMIIRGPFPPVPGGGLIPGEYPVERLAAFPNNVRMTARAALKILIALKVLIALEVLVALEVLAALTALVALIVLKRDPTVRKRRPGVRWPN